MGSTEVTEPYLEQEDPHEQTAPRWWYDQTHQAQHGEKQHHAQQNLEKMKSRETLLLNKWNQCNRAEQMDDWQSRASTHVVSGFVSTLDKSYQ